MEPRARARLRLRRALTLAVAAALLVALVAGCADRERAGEKEAGEPGGLEAPTGIGPATVGPPLYDSKNTDGQAGSGPRAVVYHSSGRTVTDAAVTAQAPDPLLFRTGFGSWEPTLAINSKGTIFFDARNTNVDPGIARSKDNGVTWQGINPDAHKVSLDPYLWLDPATGRLFDSDIDPSVTCPPLSHSDDEGKTWQTSVSCGASDHQNVFGGPPPAGADKPSGYPSVVYYCAISGGALAGSSTITACSKSLDGGDSFVPTGDPAFPAKVTGDPNQPNCDGGAGHGIADAKGTIYVPRMWCGPPYVAISHDEGATWEQVQVADKPQLGFSTADGGYPHESGIAADRAGNLYYAWVADDHHPHLSTSRDGGRTWSAPLDILPPGANRFSAFTESIDAGDAGRVAAVFMGTADAPAVGPKTRWSAYVITSADALSSDPTFYGATMNDPQTNALWIGDCADLRCGNIGDFLDVVIAPDGTAWSALVDSCPNAGDQCTEFGVTEPRGEAVAGHLVDGPPLIGTVAQQQPGVTLPPAACRSRRRFRIRLREPRHGRLVSARVYVDGRRVRVVRGKRLRAAIDLRGLRKGRYTVRVVATTTSGRRLVRTRRYRTCVPRG